MPTTRGGSLIRNPALYPKGNEERVPAFIVRVAIQRLPRTSRPPTVKATSLMAILEILF